MEEGGLVEEITDFAALLVLLRRGEEPVLGLLGEELTDARHREDYLLHASVQAHNLQEAGRRGGCRQILPVPRFGFLFPSPSCASPNPNITSHTSNATVPPSKGILEWLCWEEH